MKKPNEVTAGKSCADYGGHELALNFPYQQIDSSGKMNNVKVGSATIGLMYDGDWKTAANDGRTRCLVSQKKFGLPYRREVFIGIWQPTSTTAYCTTQRNHETEFASRGPNAMAHRRFQRRNQ
jgi:hypothetical protein